MKKNKDFRYYGKKYSQVQRILRALNEDSKYDHSLLYALICFVLVAVCENLQKVFNVDLGIICGVLYTICIGCLIWCLGNAVTYLVCTRLDKYYFSKRVELFNKYLEEKKALALTRNNTKE